MWKPPEIVDIEAFENRAAGSTVANRRFLDLMSSAPRPAFHQSPRRLPVILTPPEPFFDMDPADILKITCWDAECLVVRVRQHIVEAARRPTLLSSHFCKGHCKRSLDRRGIK